MTSLASGLIPHQEDVSRLEYVFGNDAMRVSKLALHFRFLPQHAVLIQFALASHPEKHSITKIFLGSSLFLKYVEIPSKH